MSAQCRSFKSPHFMPLVSCWPYFTVMGLRCSKYFQIPLGLSGSYMPWVSSVILLMLIAENEKVPVGSRRPMGSTSITWVASFSLVASKTISMPNTSRVSLALRYGWLVCVNATAKRSKRSSRSKAWYSTALGNTTCCASCVCPFHTVICNSLHHSPAIWSKRKVKAGTLTGWAKVSNSTGTVENRPSAPLTASLTYPSLSSTPPFASAMRRLPSAFQRPGSNVA